MIKLKIHSVSGYRKVAVVNDRSSGLHAVIAIHSTALGPSLGGVRMFPYPSEKAAVTDALRLAKAMTAKAAISGLKLGGGKAVIIGNPSTDKSRALFLALGEFIQKLGGLYIAAEDSGIRSEDLNIVAEKTSFVTGTTRMRHGSGDPSPSTAAGIYEGIRACSRRVFGTGSLRGRAVAIQGVGQVGFGLARLLHRAGCRLIVSDPSRERLKFVAASLPVKGVPVSEIHRVKADIFSPCALGGVLNPKTIPEINSKIVAGGANNQFLDEMRGPAALLKRGILHAPDFVINAGGLIQLYVREIIKKKAQRPWIARIGATLEEIFEAAERESRPPLHIAQERAAAIVRAC